MAKMASTDGTWKFGAFQAESEPELVQALQIQSVPFAMAFITEQAVPLFDRPLTEEQIRMYLGKLFELAQQRGMKVEVPEIKEPEMEPEESAAIDALEKGDYAGAAMAYRNWLQRRPDEILAKIGLAQCELMIRISTLDPKRTIADADANPSSLQNQMMAADIEVAQGAHGKAFERLLKLIRESSGEDKSKAKDHLLNLFTLVDPSDPDLLAARRALASALF
jgi:putative thioredoxin